MVKSDSESPVPPAERFLEIFSATGVRLGCLGSLVAGDLEHSTLPVCVVQGAHHANPDPNPNRWVPGFHGRKAMDERPNGDPLVLPEPFNAQTKAYFTSRDDGGLKQLYVERDLARELAKSDEPAFSLQVVGQELRDEHGSLVMWHPLTNQFYLDPGPEGSIPVHAIPTPKRIATPETPVSTWKVRGQTKYIAKQSEPNTQVQATTTLSTAMSISSPDFFNWNDWKDTSTSYYLSFGSSNELILSTSSETAAQWKFNGSTSEVLCLKDGNQYKLTIDSGVNLYVSSTTTLLFDTPPSS